MTRVITIFRREFAAYFATPLAAVFVVIFLFLSGLFTFNIGGLYERSQADLRPFFQYLPWLFLFLVPAISMRLWAEERRSGTIELLLTLPFTITDLVLGKFLAAWCFAGVALALTTPLWISVAWLGDPDAGVAVAGYAAAMLLCGAFLAVGSCISACTKNQVIAFVLCVGACFLLMLTGFPFLLEFFESWAPPSVLEALSAMSALSHFEAVLRGVVDGRDALYFVSVIAVFLMINVVIIDWRRGG
ncbi:MAG: ABC transporter permease [Phycisphaerales bacterium]|nr:ABC transporter permease [Phycisphaerales bacterium]